MVDMFLNLPTVVSVEGFLGTLLDKSLDVVKKLEKGEKLRTEDLVVLALAMFREQNRRIDETNKRIDSLADSLNKRIDALADSLNKRIDETNKRIDSLEARIDDLQKAMLEIQKLLVEMNKTMLAIHASIIEAVKGRTSA